MTKPGEVLSLLSANLLQAGLLQGFFSGEAMNLAQYGALTALLLRNRVPFDVKFTPSNGRDPSELVVTAYITPKVTVDFSFSELNLAQAT